MNYGSLGNVTFSVSDEQVKTFQKMKWTQTADYATHKVHGQPAVMEFTGFSPQKLTFDMELSAWLGVSPTTELERLQAMLTEHDEQLLVLGNEIIGSRWHVTSISTDFGHVYRDGTLLSCKVSVTLQG